VIGKVNRLRGEERRWRPLEVLDDFFRITYCVFESNVELLDWVPGVNDNPRVPCGYVDF
jgi:hypothetical protein